MKSVVSESILDAIGNTPLLEVEGIYCKLEYLNPSGSIKARIAKYMIERAEREGLLSPGDTIVEATSGNTGNALSMVAAAKGYRMLVVMPEGMTGERVAISRAFGAEVLQVGTSKWKRLWPRRRSSGDNPATSARRSSSRSGTSRRTGCGWGRRSSPSSPRASSPTPSSWELAPAEPSSGSAKPSAKSTLK